MNLLSKKCGEMRSAVGIVLMETPSPSRTRLPRKTFVVPSAGEKSYFGGNSMTTSTMRGWVKIFNPESGGDSTTYGHGV